MARKAGRRDLAAGAGGKLFMACRQNTAWLGRWEDGLAVQAAELCGEPGEVATKLSRGKTAAQPGLRESAHYAQTDIGRSSGAGRASTTPHVSQTTLSAVQPAAAAAAKRDGDRASGDAEHRQRQDTLVPLRRSLEELCTAMATARALPPDARCPARRGVDPLRWRRANPGKTKPRAWVHARSGTSRRQVGAPTIQRSIPNKPETRQCSSAPVCSSQGHES